MRLKLTFSLSDVWVGLFWKKEVLIGQDGVLRKRLLLFVCLVPCLPIILEFRWEA